MLQDHCDDLASSGPPSPSPLAEALAQQGTSSCYGTVGCGLVISTISLTNKEHAWNNYNQAIVQSEDAAGISARAWEEPVFVLLTRRRLLRASPP